MILIIKYKDINEIRFHYVWIENLSALVNSQVSTMKVKLHISDRCLHYFREEYKLKEHEKDCQKLNNHKVNVPEIPESVLEFKNQKREIKVPYVIYADIESIL